MSYTTVNEMIAKIVYDAKVNTINEFKAFLADRIEIEDMEDDFANFIKTLKETAPLPEKKGRGSKKSDNTNEKKSNKRQPTLFNLFVKNKMTTIKLENPEKKGKEIIALASESWKSDPFASFLQDKNQIDALKEDSSEMSNELLFEKAKLKFDKLADVKPVESKTEKPKATKVPKKPKAPKDTKTKLNKKGGKKQSEVEQESDSEVELGEEAFPDLNQDNNSD